MRPSLVRLSPLLVVLALVLPATAPAQVQPYAPGCQVDCYGVTVSPDNSPLPAGQNTSGNVWFSVSNTGQNSDTYTLTCSGSGGVVCDSIQVQTGPLLVAFPPAEGQVTRVQPMAPTCPPSCGGGGGGSTTATVSLAGSASASVQAWYHVTTTSGTLTLNATSINVSDDGSYNVMVQLTPTGPVVARDLCLTIAAGPSAAYECGDLRIVHRLPAIRTLDKLRAPTLFYNMQHAYPFPSVNADLTLAANDRPDSIIAIARLKVGGVYAQRDRRAWAGTQWGVSSQAATRRVMTNFPASDLATGLYPFQLELGRLVSGVGYTAIRTDTGTVAIVNRLGSPFGAGWWVAGFEQLKFLADNSIMWIGGDGSVRRYVSLGAWSGKTWYVARPVGGPDTLAFNGAAYTRYLKGGARVVYNTAGFHVQTVNRLGYTTVFAPDGSNRLSTITVPPPSGAGRSYTFAYGGPNGTLSSVASPDSLGGSSRTTLVGGTAITGGARIATLTDPGIATSVQFVYGNGSYPAAITGRTDRRGATTTFTLGTGLKLVGSSLPVPGAQTIARTFCPAETRIWACGTGLTPPESTYTIYVGPRTDSVDVTHFWLDSLGAVTQIRDAYSYLTTVARTDTRWPELATRVQSPSGRIVAATYDTRGNLAAVADSNPYSNGQNPTTRYIWDQTWDQLTQLTLPNGQLTQFGVDPGNGNRLWIQDRRGTVSRTTFQYYASGNGAGLLSTVIPPLGARTTVTYDGRGNAASVQTGGWTTYFQNDSLGRTKVTRTPIALGQYRSDTTTYDAADRPVRVTSFASSNPTDSARTTIYNFYDAESNLYQVQRRQIPNPDSLNVLTTQWVLDAANRPTVQIAPDNVPDSTWYDPAGNVDSVKTRNGKVLAMSHDRMNRLRRRIIPPVSYPAIDTTGFLTGLYIRTFANPTSQRHFYPWYPNNGTGLTIDGNIETFAYDSGGRLVAAENGDALVHRTFFTNGLIRLDSLYSRNYSGSAFGHVYGLKYSYDLNGRRIALRHPAQLAIGPGVRDSVRYVYSDTTGAISAIYSPLGNQSSYLYDLRGALVRQNWPGSIIDSMAYDSLGRLTLDRIDATRSSSFYKDPDPYLRWASLQYAVDPAQVSSVTNTHGWKDTYTATYSGLGYLTSLSYRRPQNLSDLALYVHINGDSAQQRFSLDPLGNAYAGYSAMTQSFSYEDVQTVGSTSSSVYQRSTGRVLSQAAAGGNRAFRYDNAGNTIFAYQTSVPSGRISDRASWYGADGRLRVEEWREALVPGSGDPAWKDIFEEFRYDALGRRVLVMSRRDCYCASDSTVATDYRMSRIRRTVWDGARELWEIQMPARAQDAAYIENDTATVTYPYATAGNGPSDQNPLFGRLAYTYAGGLDRPTVITRFKLVRRKSQSDIKYWNPVELQPAWNWRGEAELGTFQDGGMQTCTDSTHCVFVQWRGLGFATGLVRELLWTPGLSGQSPYGWFGSLIYDKVNGTGTFDRRNRHVDPLTGRFTQEDPIGLAGGINLYGYAGSNPLAYTDPFGLRPDTIEVGWHEVGKTGAFHASIRITPDDQAKWSKDSRFKPGADGRVSLTLGAGPKACLPQGMCLISDANRPTDVAAQKGSQVLDLGGRDENAVIGQLLRADAEYGDNLQYSLLPSANGMGYNSNSYTAGILEAAGIRPPTLPVSVPGWIKPIPLPFP